MNDNHPQNQSVDSYGLGLSNPKLHSVTGSHPTGNQYNPFCVVFVCHPLGSFQKRMIYLKLFFFSNGNHSKVILCIFFINILVSYLLEKYTFLCLYISYSHIRNRCKHFYLPQVALFCQTPRFASQRFQFGRFAPGGIMVKLQWIPWDVSVPRSPCRWLWEVIVP